MICDAEVLISIPLEQMSVWAKAQIYLSFSGILHYIPIYLIPIQFALCVDLLEGWIGWCLPALCFSFWWAFIQQVFTGTDSMASVYLCMVYCICITSGRKEEQISLSSSRWYGKACSKQNTVYEYSIIHLTQFSYALLNIAHFRMLLGTIIEKNKHCNQSLGWCK